ncbi:MAG: hypothetical protein E6R04_06740 [Spirochaetes bacterium]|nr:MAG: hypothetical protein E6R04_06740 [Spirochaetota bacterium]
MSTFNPTRIRKLTDEEMDRYCRDRARAYRNAPEIAEALYALVPVYAENAGTWAVDGKGRIYISYEGWAGTWSEEDRALAPIHEAWHWLRQHPQRLPDMLSEHPEWASVIGHATDMEINDDLPKNCTPPEQWVYPKTHGLPEGWIAEQYAEALAKKNQQQQQQGGNDQQGDGSDQNGGSPKNGSDQGQQGDGSQQGQGSSSSQSDSDQRQGQGGGSPQNGQGQQQGGGSSQGAPDGSMTGMGGGHGGCSDVPQGFQNQADEVAEGLSEGMQRYVEEAVAREIQRRADAGIGNLPSGITGWAADKLRPPKIDWRRKMRVSLLGQIIAVKGNAKASFDQPNRRHMNTDFIIPGRRAVDPNVLIGVDVSGSMLGGCLDMAVAQATSILRARGIKKIRTVEVDVRAGGVKTQRGKKLQDLDVVGGGTDMRVFFDTVREMPHRARPSNAILFTDGYTEWPSETDVIPGTKFLVGIICDESRYDSLAAGVPSWIEPVQVPDTVN